MKKLSQILNGINYSGKADERIIEGISYDSRKVKNRTLFIAIQGLKENGNKYIDDAIKLGANALLVNNDIDQNYSIPLLKVNNTRKAMSRIAANFFNCSSKNIQITGITGTNGKTTITELTNYILKTNNYPTSSLGTLGFQGPNGTINTGFTTPESLELQHIFHTLYKAGIQHLVMEVSSHSLSLNRVDDVDIDIAVFTNLTEEHLDFHGNIDNYFKSKLKLFTNLSSDKIAIINVDDPYSRKIIKKTKAKILTYGFNKKANIYPEKIDMSLDGTQFYINYKEEKFKIKTHLIGDFNISNILASILICSTVGIKINQIANSINNFCSVPGRFESYKKEDGSTIIVDYAHTPDAFDKILSVIKNISPNKKIISLFGCGGNRDSKKRPIMAKISEQYSHQVIITDDNPRYENSEEIIKQIISGFKFKNYKIINDRKQAIVESVNNLKHNDILVILGKGIENHQIIKNKKVHHSDIDIIKSLI